LHGQIARALEERFRDAMEGRPETLPHHFTEAGLFKKAVGYWCRAGRQSVAKSGFVEAITQLRTGLRLIADLPDTRERKQRELEIQIAVAGALSVVGTVNLGRHALAPIALPQCVMRGSRP
jgi:predicted ATPase